MEIDTPSTSNVIVATNSGTDVQDGPVFYEWSDSGTFKRLIEVDVELEFLDEEVPSPNVSPRNLSGADNISEAAPAEPLVLDSGSEDDIDPNIEIEESLNQDLNCSDTWSKDFSTFKGTRETFHEVPGSTISGKSPSEIFSQLWDIPLIDMIVKETNEYAWQTIAATAKSETGISANSRVNNWVETSVAEMYSLIAVIIFMGMCLRGRVDDYWADGVMGMSGFRRLMSKNRYLILMRFLHFTDNNCITERGTDRKIAKVKPIIDYLNCKFKDSYVPRQELALDKSFMRVIQVISSKAARLGVKCYGLCESATGYVLNIIVYYGKNEFSNTPLHGFNSVTAKIVLTLLAEYMNRGYTVFMDDFYNSVTLCKFLKQNGTDVVGALNRRRPDTPREIRALDEKRMVKGSVLARHCGSVSVLAWKDMKLVTTVSTYHSADMKPGRRFGQEPHIPLVVHDYSKFMRGVDTKNQKLSAYLLERKKCSKWYINVFKRLLNISIVNAYIIYCSNMAQERKLSHHEFRYLLADELAHKYGSNYQTREINRVVAHVRLDRSIHHVPEHEEITDRTTDKQNRYKRRRCFICLKKRERKTSNIRCRACNVYLCVGDCWLTYHKSDKI